MHDYNPPSLDFTQSDLDIESRYHAITAMLKDYECQVNFTKINNEERILNCTLQDNFMPAHGKMLAENILEEEMIKDFHVITVWSTDHKAWRSMRTMNVNSVILKPKTWTVPIEEDPETGDGLITFPPDFLSISGWQEGDVISWKDNGDGSWTLEKKST